MAEPASWLTIGENRYECSGAKIVCSMNEDGLSMEVYSFDPLSVAKDFFQTHAGITINGVTWPGAATVKSIAGSTLSLTSDEDSELTESVFWERGTTLEITSLELVCLSLAEETMTLGVKAQLFDPEDDREVSAEGMVVGRLVVK